MHIGVSYQKYIAPPPISFRNETERIIVDVSVDIIDILEMDEISSIFQVQFYLHFTWYDSRLIFYNLNEDVGLNSLSPEEMEMIWSPVLEFDNTELKPSTIVDQDSKITIVKVGNYTMPGIDQPIAWLSFQGDENPILLSRFYNIKCVDFLFFLTI